MFSAQYRYNIAKKNITILSFIDAPPLKATSFFLRCLWAEPSNSQGSGPELEEVNGFRFPKLLFPMRPHFPASPQVKGYAVIQVIKNSEGMFSDR